MITNSFKGGQDDFISGGKQRSDKVTLHTTGESRDDSDDADNDGSDAYSLDLLNSFDFNKADPVAVRAPATPLGAALLPVELTRPPPTAVVVEVVLLVWLMFFTRYRSSALEPSDA